MKPKECEHGVPAKHTCYKCGEHNVSASGSNELLCDVELLKKQRDYFEQSHLTSLIEINYLHDNIAQKIELLNSISADLKMRADENGVINISDFIWRKLRIYGGT